MRYLILIVVLIFGWRYWDSLPDYLVEDKCGEGQGYRECTLKWAGKILANER